MATAMNVVMVIDTVNGQGHVSRSTALREAMPEWDVAVTVTSATGATVTTGAGEAWSSPDLIVVDDYRVSASLIAHWQDRCPVVVFDDGQFPDVADAAITVSAHGGADGILIHRDGRVRLCGHNYCPIRKMGEVPVVDGVMPVLGGDMRAWAMSQRIGLNISMPIVYYNWPSRPQLLVCAGGQTCLEAAYLGVPSVIVTVADNQNANARGLQDAGLARWFGTWAEATANPGALAECVREQLANAAWREHVAVEGPKWIDGKGGARLVEHMRRLVQR